MRPARRLGGALRLFSILIPIQAAASPQIDRGVDELYRLSSGALRVTVQRISGECGASGGCAFYKVSSKLDSSIKNLYSSQVGEEFDFCSLVPLEPGSEYSVFLFQSKQYGNLEDLHCEFVVPRDGAFQARSGDTFRVNSPESSVLFDFEGKTYRSSAVLEPGFEKTIERLSQPAVRVKKENMVPE